MKETLKFYQKRNHFGVILSLVLALSLIILIVGYLIHLIFTPTRTLVDSTHSPSNTYTLNVYSEIAPISILGTPNCSGEITNSDGHTRQLFYQENSESGCNYTYIWHTDYTLEIIQNGHPLQTVDVRRDSVYFENDNP